jgi:hypothetical protein
MAIPLRHELKFFITEMQYQVLSRMLKSTLSCDENGDENNEYHIRSLYFDTIFDDALHDKLDGVRNRDKYRIRIYNFLDNNIRMECKTKIETLISKRSAQITRGLCEQLIAADPTGLEATSSGLLRDVYREMRINLLHPVVLVDYVREAYIHPAETVRITFDKQLRTGLFSTDLFDRHVPTIPPFSNGEIILEVKYDRVLPPYLADILSYCAGGALHCAVSKYTICRGFEGIV